MHESFQPYMKTSENKLLTQIPIYDVCPTNSSEVTFAKSPLYFNLEKPEVSQRRQLTTGQQRYKRGCVLKNSGNRDQHLTPTNQVGEERHGKRMIWTLFS